MQRAPLVTWRHVEPTAEATQLLGTWLDRLDKSYPRIQRCEVTVETPHRHREAGNLFHIRVKLTVPGEELVVSRDPPEHQAHEELTVAIRDAFQATKRRLQDHAMVVRGDVKVSEDGLLEGLVTTLNPDKDHGFIRDRQGREIYFQRNSVMEAGFDALSVGDTVRFSEQEGDEGPRASTVHLN